MVKIMEEKENKKNSSNQNSETLKKNTENKKNKKSAKKKKLTQADIKKYSSTEIDHVILKIKANERKYKIISVTVILLLFLICSYIVFSAVQDSHVKSTFRIGKLYYEFNETSNGLGNVISLVDVSPLSDEDGSRTRTYKVKVYNSSSKKEKVKIFIFDDKEMVSLDNCHNKLVGREFIKYSINGNESIFLGDEEKSIISEELDAKESKTYIIRCWVSDTYTENDVVHYHGTIVVKQDNMKKEK